MNAHTTIAEPSAVTVLPFSICAGIAGLRIAARLQRGLINNTGDLDDDTLDALTDALAALEWGMVGHEPRDATEWQQKAFAAIEIDDSVEARGGTIVDPAQQAIIFQILHGVADGTLILTPAPAAPQGGQP